MTSKSVAKVAVDWSRLSSRMSAQDMTKFNKLKAQVDATGVKLASLPDSLPKLDWSHYKAHASNPKIVEELEKKYASVEVKRPVVPSKRLAELQEAYDQDLERYNKYCEYVKSYIGSAEELKKKFDTMIPVKDMSMEDWTLTFPHWSFTKDNPSIWPHFGRTAGLTREEAAAFDQPDPVPFATKSAWKDWETKYKKWYE